MTKITDRGWAGHFICANRCMFRRNTLIEGDKDSVVVSTVGAMRVRDGEELEAIGLGGRYYETMVFGTHHDGGYIDAKVSDERSFDSEGSICADSINELPDDVDNKANAMHDAIVVEMAKAI